MKKFKSPLSFRSRLVSLYSLIWVIYEGHGKKEKITFVTLVSLINLKFADLYFKRLGYSRLLLKIEVLNVNFTIVTHYYIISISL